LNYLKTFPIDQLKIDQSFVLDVLEDPNDEAIVNAIIVIAQKLNLKVIAEGVETQGQAKYLLQQGCELAQGFFYYKPMPIDDIKRLKSPLRSQH